MATALNTTRPPIRLVTTDGSANGKAGRLEIYHNGIWGTVGDSAVSEYENSQKEVVNNSLATVVCRMLGLKGGVVKKSSHFGRGSGPIWFTQIGCHGDENSIFECSGSQFSNGAESHIEAHEADVGIICE